MPEFGASPELRLRRVWQGEGGALVRGALSIAAGAYRGALAARDTGYAAGMLSTRRLPVPVISIGNLTLGGSGKTPSPPSWPPPSPTWGRARPFSAAATARRTRGVRVVADRDGVRLSASEAGDEPRLLAEQLPGTPVVVGESRYEAGRVAVERCGAHALVLDDGFQHRTLAKDLEILAVPGTAPWGNGRLFPRGVLREPMSALRRVSVAVVTNPPHEATAASIAESLRRHGSPAVVLTGTYQVHALRHGSDGTARPPETLAGRRVVALAGPRLARGIRDHALPPGRDRGRARGVPRSSPVYRGGSRPGPGIGAADRSGMCGDHREGLDAPPRRTATRLRPVGPLRAPRHGRGPWRSRRGPRGNAPPKSHGASHVMILDGDVLVVRLPNWLGDTVMALPALAALRAARPDALVTAVGPWAPLLTGQAVADVLLKYPRDGRTRRKLAVAMRAMRPDAAVLLPNPFESALAARRWGARIRLGYDTDMRHALLTHMIDLPSPRRHQVDEYTGLLEAADIPAKTERPEWRLGEDPVAEAEVTTMLTEAGCGERDR